MYPMMCCYLSGYRVWGRRCSLFRSNWYHTQPAASMWCSVGHWLHTVFVSHLCYNYAHIFWVVECELVGVSVFLFFPRTSDRCSTSGWRVGQTTRTSRTVRTSSLTSTRPWPRSRSKSGRANCSSIVCKWSILLLLLTPLPLSLPLPLLLLLWFIDQSRFEIKRSVEDPDDYIHDRVTVYVPRGYVPKKPLFRVVFVLICSTLCFIICYVSSRRRTLSNWLRRVNVRLAESLSLL